MLLPFEAELRVVTSKSGSRAHLKIELKSASIYTGKRL